MAVRFSGIKRASWRRYGGDCVEDSGSRPAEAAITLGVPASTLRLYSVRFASLLSEGAAHPIERAGGRPGFRIYMEQDLALLREGKKLLEQGLTYDEALAELRRRYRPRLVRPQERPTRGSEQIAREEEAAPAPPSGTPAPQVAPEQVAPREAAPREPERESAWLGLTGQLLASLTSAQAVAEEWRRIVEERNAEIAVLRERLRAAEERAGRSWWRRLFGG